MQLALRSRKRPSLTRVLSFRSGLSRRRAKEQRQTTEVWASPEAAAQASRVYGECERARNGEAYLYGRADDGATKSPPRKTGTEGSKSRQGPRGGSPRSHGGPFAVAVKAPALAGCRG